MQVSCKRPAAGHSIGAAVLVGETPLPVPVRERADVVVRVNDRIAWTTIAHLEIDDILGTAIDQVMRIAVARPETGASWGQVLLVALDDATSKT